MSTFYLGSRKTVCVCVCGGGHFPDGSVVENPPPSAEDMGLIPGSGRCPGEGYGNPLQYCCLQILMHRGAWHATAYGGSQKSWTQLSE